MFNHPIIDPPNTVIIEATQDEGFIISKFVQWDDESWHVKRQVYEPQITIEMDLENIASMLWGVLGALEIYMSDHDNKRLEIEVVEQGGINTP